MRLPAVMRENASATATAYRSSRIISIGTPSRPSALFTRQTGKVETQPTPSSLRMRTMPVATSIVMDVVSFAWSRAVSLRVGGLKHTMISRVPSPSCPMLSTNRRQQRIAFEPTTPARPWRREPLLTPEAVRKPFCGPSGRKIDSNGTPHTHQRFAEAAPSILLLRANNHFERFHTAWPHKRRRNLLRCRPVFDFDQRKLPNRSSTAAQQIVSAGEAAAVRENGHQKNSRT